MTITQDELARAVAAGIGGGRDEARRIKPGSGEGFHDAPFAPEMVVVPPGSFMMGSPDDEPERESAEAPQHRVTIATPFAIGRDAITRGQFAAFVNESGHKMEDGAEVWDGSKWKLDASKSWRDPGFAQDDNHPVVCVSHDDAQSYAKWLREKTGKGYRLSSEAEWEYACRAATTTPFWWGTSITPEQANYDGTADVYKGGGKKGERRKKTMPVASFQPNPWVLYQVHGNVWEWCEDVWHDGYEGAPTDGAAWMTGGDDSLRVLRGGSWDNYPQVLRAANRN